MRMTCLLLMVVVLVGCASPGLPYKAVDNPTHVPISASHRVMDDRLYVEVASENFRVERVSLILEDASELEAETIHHPAAGRSVGNRPFSVGVGGVIGGNTAVGAGVGIGNDSMMTYGNTVAIFPASKVGAGPWRLHVKLVSFAPVEINLPALEAPEE